MKSRLVYHVAPDKKLEQWAVIKEGSSEPRKKGLSKDKAIAMAKRLIARKAKPAVVLVHKTRYIIERQLQVST
ncbi:MAG TPA: DUF2188 domain-containing protein [Verrucomicrobiae bacterium]